MKEILLIGKDFDFSIGDGISRCCYEIYNGLKSKEDVNLIITKKRGYKKLLSLYTPIFREKNLRKYDIIHFMYIAPHIIKLNEETKKILLWYDDTILNHISEYKIHTKKGRGWRLVKRLAIATLNQVDTIICISTISKAMLINFLNETNITRNFDIFIINLGISNKFIKEKAYKGKRKDFVYIGHLGYSNKNIRGLINSFNLLRLNYKEEQKLHIFTPTTNADEIIEPFYQLYPTLRNLITLHIKATDEEMIETSKKAIAGLQLTIKEGFGLPILELQAIGTPVIVLKDAEISEEVKRYAIQIKDETDINPIIQAKISKEAIQYAKSFTWERYLKELNKIYDTV